MAMDLVRLKRLQMACLALVFASIGALFVVPDYMGIALGVFAVALVGHLVVTGAIRSAAPVETGRPERRLRNVVVIAVIAALADLFFLGPMLSIVMMGFAVIYYLPRALIAWKAKPLLRLRLAKGLAVFAIGLAAVELLSWDARLGRERAGSVIAAVERYKADNGSYPERLENLVPGYLPAIPDARMLVSAPRFYYIPHARGAILMYVVAPPFLRATYDFETREWHEMD